MEATRERKPELVIVDTLKDKHNRTVKVGYRGGDVEIIVTPHSGHDGRIAFDGEQRDRFMRAFAAAEQEIERDDAELEHRRETAPGHLRECCDHCNNREGDPAGHGYVPGGSLHDGPCEQCAAEQTCEGGC
jgi:hypothetical protein